MRHRRIIDLDELRERVRFPLALFAGLAVASTAYHLVPWILVKLLVLCAGILYMLLVLDHFTEDRIQDRLR